MNDENTKAFIYGTGVGTGVCLYGAGVIIGIGVAFGTMIIARLGWIGIDKVEGWLKRKRKERRELNV